MFVLAGIVMLGVLVVVHEFGHFVVAKLFRVGVPVFSVGMGPRLLGVFWRGTDYRLSAFPVGGYVRLAGADPFGDEDPDAGVPPEEDFGRKPVWQRLLVMVAGPAFNLALPVVLFTVVLMFGEPQPDPSVGMVSPGSVAAEAGIRPGDEIVAVGGVAVETWVEVVEVLEAHGGGPLVLTVRRTDGLHPVTLDGDLLRSPPTDRLDTALGLWSLRASTRLGVDDPTSPAARAGLVTGDAVVEVDGEPVSSWEQLEHALSGASHAIRWRRADPATGEVTDRTGRLVLDAGWQPRPEDPVTNRWGMSPAALHVGGVSAGSAADVAGVRPDDRIWSVDGVVVRSWTHLLDLVRSTADTYREGSTPRSLELVLVRAGETIALEVTPRMERELLFGEVRYRPIMGIEQYPEAQVPGPRVKKYYTLFEAVPRAGKETTQLFTRTLGVLGSLFTNEIKPREALGGPVAIFQMAGEGAERGIYTYLRLIGTISISLGIINLLPVPVLDGGQILFYLVEGVRGRPLSLALRERLQMVGVLLLVGIMLMVTVFDVQRAWLGG